MNNKAAITIGRLSLSLPAGFENRAGIIGRKVADCLADYSVKKDINISHLKLPVVNINENYSNDRIAANIARSISSAMNNNPGDRK